MVSLLNHIELKLLTIKHKQMKRTILTRIFSILAIIFIVALSSTAQNTIEWTGKKVGGEHSGTLMFNTADLKFKNNELVSGTFEVDMQSITCTDMQGEYGDKLVGHLKSEDFFNTEEYPVSSFTSIKIKQLEDGSYSITGELTIKEITQIITFPASVSIENGIATSKATVSVDRSKFDVRYGSKSFFDNLGDKVIHDEFQLDITIVTQINDATNSIKWTGKKIGGEHSGALTFNTADLVFEDNILVSGEFEVDMLSITCTDMQGEYGDKLVGHLKSEDFFNVEAFPESRFESTAVKQIDNNTYSITGDLSIKDITQTITFPASVDVDIDNGIATSKATLSVDRSKFDVRYGSKSFFDNLGDKVIHDEFQLDIIIVTAL